MIEPEHVSTTRGAYDGTADVYVQYIGTEISASIEADLDRSLLEALHRTEVLGRPVSLTSYRHDPLDVARRLAAGGFEVDQPVVRAAVGEHESTPQAFISARAGE